MRVNAQYLLVVAERSKSNPLLSHLAISTSTALKCFSARSNLHIRWLDQARF